MFVVYNVLLSTLIINDGNPKASQVFSKTLYNIYRRYPDSMIRACVTRLSKNNLMSKFREKNKNVDKNAVSKMASHKLSVYYNFILDTKYHFSSLIDPTIATSNLINHEGPSEALVLTSLASSRGVKYQIEIPHEVLSLDNETKNRFCDLLNPESRKESKDSSRALLASYRSQVAQRPEISERFTADSFILNKCKVTAQLGTSDKFPPSLNQAGSISAIHCHQTMNPKFRKVRS